MEADAGSKAVRMRPWESLSTIDVHYFTEEFFSEAAKLGDSDTLWIHFIKKRVVLFECQREEERVSASSCVNITFNTMRSFLRVDR